MNTAASTQAPPRPRRNDLKIYDDVAAEWWSDEIKWVRTLRNMVPARLNHFDRYISWPGKCVLDLGCSGGFMAEAIARRGARVTGIDPAEAAIAAARAHARTGGLEIDYQTGVGESLPFGDAGFDAVVCVDVLEHVQDLERVLQESARVLKPGGLFLYDTINRNRVARFLAITLAEDVVGLLPKGTHDPELFIRPSELKVRLLGAGLHPGPITGLGPVGVNLRGDPVFGRLPLSTVIYMGTAGKAG